ncbi:hypothetical protein AVL62_01615 [Serinicoccus chungangensis]|uniref:DUF308 domain-containing protein n=1 Tax=Serinicoccus chungangensis TaxID=767452 RepID=A0A0W8I5G4_9MICO|nr:hypothetical protein [Serinicoccus chungangensis]KUG53514.1 hypothetical protein AVL62_01615 [Serinicoccus chungangensis]
MSHRSPEDGPADPDVDRAFREIVAGLRGEADTQHRGAVNPPWPSAPDPEPTSGRPSHLGPRTPEGMATDHRSYEPPEVEDDDHFVPPPPEPLPAGDLHFWGIVVGLVVGPLLVVLAAVVPLLHPVFAVVGAVLAIGGFVLLVLRQPRRRPPFDGDDGARV